MVGGATGSAGLGSCSFGSCCLGGGSDARGTGSLGSCGASGSSAIRRAAPRDALAGFSAGFSSGDPGSSPNASRSARAQASREREKAAPAPFTASALPATPSLPAAAAARSAQRSVATTSDAQHAAVSRTAAPQVESPDSTIEASADPSRATSENPPSRIPVTGLRHAVLVCAAARLLVRAKLPPVSAPARGPSTIGAGDIPSIFPFGLRYSARPYGSPL